MTEMTTMEDSQIPTSPTLPPQCPLLAQPPRKLTPDEVKEIARKKKEHFWTSGLSLDETRVSMIIICMILCMGLAFYMYLFTPDGDIPASLQNILISFIVGIAGANAISSFARYGSGNYMGYNNYNTYGSTYGNGYYDNYQGYNNYNNGGPI